MNNSNIYYTTGEFVKLTHVTKKTLRYYDEHNILKPSKVLENGTRQYSVEDLGKMNEILLFKNLGFSLADIKELTINNSDSEFVAQSLKLQQKLVEDKIEQLQIVSTAIKDTYDSMIKNENINWSNMLSLIQSINMEHSLKNQYQNASNISSRINLHTLYSKNKEGWFPFIYKNCNIKEEMNILEIGCGDGQFWTDNLLHIPQNISICLSDISKGMLRDAKQNIGNDARFLYKDFDCSNIPYDNNFFDLIIGNHVIFYCSNIEETLKEIKRVLKPGGTFVCSTYGENHMKEISELVASFDDRITLSADCLYKRFGKENGDNLLNKHFNLVEWIQYEDSLLVTNEKHLISYVLSCHGNQNKIIIDKYKEFKNHVNKKMGNGFYITKDAGIFICKK